jgi:hypothetical protein
MQNWLLELQVATLVLSSKYEVVHNMSRKLSNYNMYEKGMRKRRKKWRDCTQGFELSTIVHRVVCEGSCKSPKLCMRVMFKKLKPTVIKKNRSNSKKRRRTKKNWVFYELFWCCKI